MCEILYALVAGGYRLYKKQLEIGAEAKRSVKRFLDDGPQVVLTKVPYDQLVVRNDGNHAAINLTIRPLIVGSFSAVYAPIPHVPPKAEAATSASFTRGGSTREFNSFYDFVGTAVHITHADEDEEDLPQSLKYTLPPGPVRIDVEITYSDANGTAYVTQEVITFDGRKLTLTFLRWDRQLSGHAEAVYARPSSSATL